MTGIYGTSPAGLASELAVLMLENESEQEKSARLERDAARQSYLDSSQKQVDALHDAADATKVGAWTSAAFTATSGAAMLAGSTTCGGAAKRWDALAKTTGALSQPANVLLGEAPAGHARANAKQYEVDAEQAKWHAGDVSETLQKLQRSSDKILDFMKSTGDSETQNTAAIVGRI